VVKFATNVRHIPALLAKLQPERTMSYLGLSADELQHILRCCQRVLVNAFTLPADLKHYLVACLREEHPGTAATVEQFTDEQMYQLMGLCHAFRGGNAAGTLALAGSCYDSGGQ
jgi:hypothetical protein